MRKIITILVILTALVSITGCASKRYTKKAQKLETAGQYSEAANLFYNALMANRTNSDAYAGLKRTGQMTLSKKLSEFNRAYNLQKNKEAILLYEEAHEYHKKLSKLDIQLNFPSYYTDYYNEVKDVFLEDKYYEGVKLLDSEKFNEAQRAFNEIIKVNSNYRDTKDKLLIAVYEPKYREGLRYMEQEKYRKAYYIFKDVAEKGNSYKSSFDLQKESLQKGTVSITIAPVKNNSSYSDVKTSLENKIANSIQSLNNPFIKILSGNSASDLTLNCEITNYKYDQGTLRNSQQKGYSRKTVKVLNKETQKYEEKTEYDKITYTEYSMVRTINMTVTYKLVDNKTRQIYKSDSKAFKSGDEITYAKYDGDFSKLVPGYWESKSGSSSKDKINDGSSSVRQLQSLFSARTRIKDYSTLSSEIITTSSDEISKAINSFILEN